MGAKLGPHLLVAHPEPWDYLADAWGAEPVARIAPRSLTRAHLESLVRDLPSAPTVIGLGGGSAMDTAKWLHWRRGIALHQVPSLPSVDACFTRMTALRDGSGVKYEGDAQPTMVHVDFDLMRSAPHELLAAGIGDVLSCHTARFDWQLALARGVTDHPWDEVAATAAECSIIELEAIAPLVRDASDEGLRRLMEQHREIGWRCHELGHARFEEGSEHFFAYCFEHVTGRTLLHGELVAVGVLIMSTLQNNEPDRVHAIVRHTGTRHSPGGLALTWEEIDVTLRALPLFVRAADTGTRSPTSSSSMTECSRPPATPSVRFPRYGASKFPGPRFCHGVSSGVPRRVFICSPSLPPPPLNRRFFGRPPPRSPGVATRSCRRSAASAAAWTRNRALRYVHRS